MSNRVTILSEDPKYGKIDFTADENALAAIKQFPGVNGKSFQSIGYAYRIQTLGSDFVAFASMFADCPDHADTLRRLQELAEQPPVDFSKLGLTWDELEDYINIMKTQTSLSVLILEAAVATPNLSQHDILEGMKAAAKVVGFTQAGKNIERFVAAKKAAAGVK